MAENGAAPGGGGGPPNAKKDQMLKLRDANNKYKSLLKMAKERIQRQEDDLERAQAEASTLRGQLEAERLRNAQLASSQSAGGGDDLSSRGGMDGDGDSVWESSAQIVRVCQRIRAESDPDDRDRGDSDSASGGGGGNGNHQFAIGDADDDDDGDERTDVWALVEFETQPTEENPSVPVRRWKSWKKFPTEAALSDYVTRDSGEPIVVPPYSLSPDQSARVEKEARQAVSHVTEEFRRYRVRAEVLRKQSDATLRALHSNNVASTQQKIEGEDLAKDLAQARTDHAQLVQLKNELKEQEAQWREAYDILLQENNALKGSGAEALLASQWRHRYEASCREKEELETKMEAMTKQAAEGSNASKYEKKYREMKESFRLYRKKAKEIFEAQQRGEMMPGIPGGGGPPNGASGFNSTINDRVGEDARLAYLRNLMVNYLCTNSDVREHMELAIGTVLKFTDEDLRKVEQAKKENDASFLSALGM